MTKRDEGAIDQTLSGVERFWGGLVLPAFAGSPRGFTVERGEVDYVAALATFVASAGTRARLGLAFALALAVTTPLWIGGRLRGFASYSAEGRAELLAAMSSHRVFLVRELCLLLKLVACLAIFRVPSTRARTSYDVPSTRLAKRALPVLDANSLALAGGGA